MQLGRHYSITIRGETYYTVCVGVDDRACYLKDINGHLLEIPYTDELAFSTVGETDRYSDALNKICDQEANKEFDTILQEAFAAKKLIAADMPLPVKARDRMIEETLIHLQRLNDSLKTVQGLLQTQDLAQDARIAQNAITSAR